MKTLFTVLFLVLGLSIATQADDYNSAPERGLLISIKPDKINVKSTEGVKFLGSIKAVNKAGDSKRNLLEEFKKDGLDTVAGFPSEAVDVSNSLQLTGISKDEIKFSFTANNINASDLNQFTVKVYNNHKNKGLLKRLAQIRAKLERRILALNELKRKSQKEKASAASITYINKQIEKLSKLSQKLSQSINKSENLLAENIYALQVDNLTANSSQISTIMNKYRFIINSEIGTAIEGMSTKITASVTNLRKSGEHDDDDEKDLKAAQFIFNDKTLFTSHAQNLNGGESISYTYTTDRLLPVNANIFSVALYHAEKNKLKKRIGWVSQKIPVVNDTVKPIWLAESSPSSASGLLYYQNLNYVNLRATDAFGRIDAATFNAKLTGSLISSEAVNQDVSSKFAKLKIGDGWEYAFSADLNPLSEGLYSLTANVKDLALNAASPHKINFRIDRALPKISLGVPENALTNKLTYQVPIGIADLSPTTTQIFVNEELQQTTASVFFTATLNLNKEGANLVKVVSEDAAGNIAISDIKTIIRDTTPPTLTFISPVQDDSVDGFYFQVSLSTNEPVVSAKLNDQAISISGETTNLSTNFSTVLEGNTALTAQATDKAGNIGEKTITVYAISRPLNQSLIGLYVDEPNNKVFVKGAVGATRPNYTVTVSRGFFSSEIITADAKGSFMVSMNPSSSYKVSVYDHRKNETVSYNYELDADNDVILSGVVRDTDDFALVNAQVSIVGTPLVTYTDSNGVFKFLKSNFPNRKVTGDQQLVIDGTGVILSAQATPRKFSKTSVSITIGVRQSNILQTPIYLAPTYLDGSATNIVAQSGGTVTDAHAPGVALSIPSGAVQFPNGQSQSLISLQTIPADRATISVPKWAKPKTVVALEPSGTTFAKPVELTLPNVNEFPPATELVVMLMNSKTGRWEIGGAAKVTADGQSITTKPNQGIRHFSLAYATIVGPNVRSIGAQDKPGADTFNGALTSQIELPSFKVLGNSFAPKLIYKSAWAKPAALVTNLFDFAKTKVDVTLPNQVWSEFESYELEIELCKRYAFGGINFCSKDPKTFYNNVQYDTSYFNVTSEIQPQRVEASLKIGNLVTDKEVFSDIPQMAAISFGVNLLKNSNEYFDSGIYPYQAHYDVYFKELMMGTYITEYWTEGMDAKEAFPAEDLDYSSPEKVFGQDLIDSVFVQNYRNSEAGTGWKIAGFQKIVNPSSNKIMLEEADGGISSYAISNTIQTVIDGANQGVDISRGVALNSWPHVSVASIHDNLEILSLTYFNDRISKKKIGSNYWLDGQLKGHDYYNYFTENCYKVNVCTNRISWPGGNACVDWREEIVCDPRIYYSSCTTHTSDYLFLSKPISMLSLGDRVIGVDAYRHSVFEAQLLTAKRILGSQSLPPQFLNDFKETKEIQGEAISQYCNSMPGLLCGSQIRTRNTYLGQNQCTSLFTQPSEIPYSGSDAIVNGKQTLNTPMSIVASPTPDVVAIADYGFHKVRWLNVSTGATGVIAGTGQTGDIGNGGLAIEASINHPKGLVYDSIGNLYISSESGYIRKVDTNGNISIVAGDPVNGKLTNESKAQEVLFNKPYGLILDQANNYLYVADTGNNRVVRINLNTDQAFTIAGNGQAGFSGDGSTALDARLNAPTHLGLDENNNLLIADSGNNKIRRVIFQNTTGGVLGFSPTTKDHSQLQRLQDGTWVRTYRDSSRVYFNNLGLQTSVVDNVNRVIHYSYDAQKRLTEVKAPTGESIQYIYSGDKLSRIIDPANRITELNYDFSGNLKSVSYPDATTKRFEYSSDGLMIAETDQKNSRREYQYNAYNRLQKVIQPDNTAVTINDSGSSNLENFEAGVTIPKQLGSGSDKLNESIIDPNGNKTELAKDFEGYISTITDAKGRVTKIKRDIEGRPIEITDIDGSITQSTYDPVFGDVIQTKNVTLDITQSQTYNEFGQVTSQTDPFGKVSTKAYNAQKQLTRETAPDGKYVSYEYNLLGLVTKKAVYDGSTNELKNQITYEYNLKGQLIKQTDLNNKFSSYTYDLAGNVLTSTSNIDGGTQSVTSYEYDLMNRLIKVISPKAEVTEYAYSPTGELIQITDPKQKITSFEYDFKGQLIKKTDPAGLVYQMTYDPNGNLLSEKDPANQFKHYTYNEINKVTKITTADDIILYDYDIKDEVIGLANNTASITYQRDTKKRITQESVSGTNYPMHTLDVEYSKNDLRTSLQSNFQNISYSYNPDNYQLVGLSSSATGNYGFNYDDASRLVQVSRPGSRTEYAYDAGSSLSRISHLKNSTEIGFHEYNYDLRNYITQKRSPASTLSYNYDTNGQLVSANKAETPSENESFSYDALGNRLTYNGVSSTYDNSGQRIQDDGQFTYVYDANGNIIYKSNKQNGVSYTFEYSALNQLKKATVTSTSLNGNVLKTIEYKYDPAGRRISRQVTDFEDSSKSKTQKYYYDGDNIIAELDADNNLTASYTHSLLRPDDVLGAKFTISAVNNGLVTSEGNVYYLKDHLNTVNEITNAAGDIVQKMEYSVFGVLRSVKNSIGAEVDFESASIRSSFTYTGREYEPELGMYYYRARYYDPSVGRFLQQDPDPGKLASPITFLSKYIYTANNPVMFSDPSGKFGWLIFFAIIAGGLIGAGNNMNAAKDAGWKSSSSQFWNSALVGFVTGVLQTAAGIFGGYPGMILGSALGSYLNNIGNQSIFKGEIDWHEAGNAFGGGFVAGVVSAGVFYGVNRYIMPVMISPIGKSLGDSLMYPNAANWWSLFAGSGTSYFTAPSGINGCTSNESGGNCNHQIPQGAN